MRWLWALVSAPDAGHWRRWYVRGVMLIVGTVVLVLGLGLVARAAPSGGPQQAYTMTHPGKNPPWFGLAAQDGRYEVLLEDGCTSIGADMNVMLFRSDGSNEATWALQVPDSDQMCAVLEWHWMGNGPCFENDAGDCDVSEAWSE